MIFCLSDSLLFLIFGCRKPHIYFLMIPKYYFDFYLKVKYDAQMLIQCLKKKYEVKWLKILLTEFLYGFGLDNVNFAYLSIWVPSIHYFKILVLIYWNGWKFTFIFLGTDSGYAFYFSVVLYIENLYLILVLVQKAWKSWILAASVHFIF